jgi:hypothetical protein
MILSLYREGILSKAELVDELATIRIQIHHLNDKSKAPEVKTPEVLPVV